MWLRLGVRQKNRQAGEVPQPADGHCGDTVILPQARPGLLTLVFGFDTGISEPYRSRESSDIIIMPLSRLFSGPFRWLVLSLLCVVCCGGVAGAQVTTFTGKVYSPLGPPNPAIPTAPHGDPIPNILVFIADPNAPLPVFTQGVTIPAPGQNGCSAQPPLVPTSNLGEALTDYTGTYTFKTYGALPTPSINVVIQAGKWRLQTQIQTSTLTLGGPNTLQPLSMPSSSKIAGADLPHIAVVTGESDAIECIFNQIGISNSEISDSNAATGSIDLYEGSSTGGEIYQSPAVPESTLVSSVTNLSKYDLVMFGCQGGTSDGNAPSYANNLTDYTSYGGRIFSTHYEYIWLKDNTTFNPVAEWLTTDPLPTNQEASQTAEINTTTFTGGPILAAWMNNIGALNTANPPELTLTNVRDNTGAVYAPAQSWGKLVSLSTISPSIQFTFDTPIGAAGTPSVAISYTNNTTSFFQGDTADSITLTVTNNSTTPTTPGLQLSISLPGGITAPLLADSSGGAWSCTAATPTSTCTLPSALAAQGGMDSVTLTFSIASNAQVGQGSLTASLSGGGLNNSSQCGRVLYNDYHVEEPRRDSAGQLYSLNEACPAQTTLTNAQKFLEYSLYNLSNFVSPSTTDLIEIQGPVAITWQPTAILYGTALSSTQLDAIANDPQSKTTILGTYIYTPPAGTVPAVGNVPLSVAFTPTDTTDYASAMGHVLLEVDKDPTTTTLIVGAGNTTPGVATPIYYGQIIGDTAIEAVTSNGPASVDGGNILYYIDGLFECTLTANAGGACPPPTGQGYNAGTHTTQSMYSGDANFLPSMTLVYNVVVLPDPTSTAITSSAPTMTPGQSITFTAKVKDTYYSPVSGTITFYDGTAVLGAVPATANAGVFSTTNLPIGAHSIKACFTSTIIPPTIQNFVNSCSMPLIETISLPPSVDPTVTVLTSSLNPSVVGQSVTFTATAATTGAFISFPTGSVNFYDGGNSIGPGILTNGVATLTTSTLAAGLHQITAAYLGSTTMAPSTSVALPQQVNTSLASAGTGFLMSVSPTTFSVGLGSSTSVVVSILELNNFNQPVMLSCSGLPAEATCIFAAPTIAATGGSTPLTVTVSGPRSCATTASLGGNTWLPILAAVVLAFFARRRRVLKGLLLAAVLCILPAISGCSSCTDLGVKPGTYTFTVVGTAGSGGVTPVTVPSGSSSAAPSITTQTQTMTMTVVI